MGTTTRRSLDGAEAAATGRRRGAHLPDRRVDCEQILHRSVHEDEHPGPALSRPAPRGHEPTVRGRLRNPAGGLGDGTQGLAAPASLPNLKPEDRHRAIGRPAPSTKRSRCGPEESGPSSWDQCSAGRGLAIARPEAAGARWAQVSTILGRVDVAPNAAPWVPHRKGATTEENGADECGLR